MKKIFLAAILMFGSSALYARNGTVTIIDKLAPKNNGTFGIVDSSQTVVSTATFSKNLNSTDVDLQTTLQTIDQLTISGGGGSGTPLEVFNNFNGARSSPTASIGMSNAFGGSVTWDQLSLLQ